MQESVLVVVRTWLRQKGYSCENKDCNFVLWKQNKFFESLGKNMTKQIAMKLLSDGKATLKGCKSKRTGNTYDTTVVMAVDENQRAVFELNFEIGNVKHGKTKGEIKRCQKGRNELSLG